jgi:hypothetical protein
MVIPCNGVLLRSKRPYTGFLFTVYLQNLSIDRRYLFSLFPYNPVVAASFDHVEFPVAETVPLGDLSHITLNL